MTHVVLSIGSNIERERNIRFAIDCIHQHWGKLDISPVYETSSVGFEGPAFYNLIVGFHSDQPLEAINEKLKEIETRAGRVRGPKTFDSRVLDIDVVLYGEENYRDRGINVPRDEIEKYAYVLKPLADIYPDLPYPVTGQTIENMWQSFEMKDQTIFIAEMPMGEAIEESERVG